ncbi:MAG TPA: orotidine-5'-phosphate decarboxylase [Steroidobacteraceae bacterium]|nr:orotidine-5'-phosphate decarboxylase [Steroidobacteraceae bacterium]
MRTDIAPQQRLIVALDVDSHAEALRLVSDLGNDVSFYKVGLQLFMAGGLTIVKRIVEQGKKVFLDLKIDDTPRTVEEAVRNSAIDGVELFTLQGNAATARAAIAGRGQRSLPKFLQVTYLSSWDGSDLLEHLNIDPGADKPSIDDRVVNRARRVIDSGCDGVIASGTSVSRLRREFPKLLIVTPGIRLSGGSSDDHKRSMTPFEAIGAGADYLVVGRPIRSSDDPKAIVHKIQQQIEQALRSKAA